jgi:hypothetical protein
MEVTVENTVLWDITPFSLVEVYRYLGEMYCLNLKG